MRFDLATLAYRVATCSLLVFIGFLLDDLAKHARYTTDVTSSQVNLRAEPQHFNGETNMSTTDDSNGEHEEQGHDHFAQSDTYHDDISEEYENSEQAHYEYESTDTDEVKERVEQRLESRRHLLADTAVMLAEWSATVRGCDGADTSNVLCATPQTVQQFEAPRYITGLKSPCVCVSTNDDSRGLHVINTEGAVPRNCRLRCLPYVYLMGFAKCGTTDLHYYISEHQLVQSGYRKEVDWWCGGKVTEKQYWRAHNVTHPLNVFAYMNMFKAASQAILEETLERQRGEKGAKHKRSAGRNTGTEQSITLESSITNALQDSFYRGIHHLNHDAKLIYIMRDPVERIFSSYRFDFQKQLHGNEENQSPEGFHAFVVNALEKIKHSRKYPYRLFKSCQYAGRILGPMRLFGRENIKLILFEEYITDPFDFMRTDILPFLGLPDYAPNVRRRFKEHAGVKNTSLKKYSMLEETRELLQGYFRSHNRKLSRVLGDDKWNWGY